MNNQQINDIYKKVFDEVPTSIQPIETGLTNHIYSVKGYSHHVVIRLPKKLNQGLFDYGHEARVLKLIEPLDLDVPILYFDDQSGEKITSYIEDSETFTIKYAKRAASLLKKLHTAKLSSHKRFHYLNTFKLFHVTQALFDLEEFTPYLKQMDLMQYEPILCHNDCVAGNFLFTQDHDYLIDYEYACDNHPYFDLMSLITENSIDDINQRNDIYLEYFGALPNHETLKVLDQFEIAHHILWCAWACMMYHLHHEDIYKEIAVDKYKRLLKKERSMIVLTQN